jgi:primosomal protein N' (replication factor Y)
LSHACATDVLNEEQSLREMLCFPPFARWVRIVFSAHKLHKAEQAAADMATHLRTWEHVRISGPMLCAMERVSGRFRVELLLRDATRKVLPWQLEPILKSVKVPSGVRRKVDVDPQDMM